MIESETEPIGVKRAEEPITSQSDPSMPIGEKDMMRR